MAVIHGVAGEWARVRGAVKGLRPLFASIFVVGFSTGMAVFFSPIIGGVLIVLALTAAIYFLYRGERRMENYYKGARGEEYVSGILRSLPDNYHVFNDFVARGEHIDHVVVGPVGVFAIETKFWNGRVTLEEDHILLNGQLPDRDPLKQVRHEGMLVKNWLAKHGWKGAVTPILAFASNTFEAPLAEAGSVVILNANHLMKSLSVDREVLSPAEIVRLSQLMETNV